MGTRAMSPGMLINDRYRLDDLLSETGEARFWRGTDTVLSRSVAINVLPSDNPAAPRLIAAARNSATVHDPRLLRVLDCDDRGEVTWVVNEWGAGMSLDILLERGPLDPTRAAWLALETATTIQAAHAAGVCHGRLTPEAVLVTNAGAVKIIGFAVSASIEGGGAGQHPEYGHLEPTEADVLDLAGILYAGLTGKWPGASPSTVPSAPTDHHGPLRPRQVRHGVPRMLDALCERVLRKAGHEHTVPIGSAVEIVAALNDFLGSPLTGAPIDISHMHLEPEHTGPAWKRPLQPGWDPEATQLSPAYSWAEETRAGVPEPYVAPAPHDPEPELPPFEDSAERPLFASTPRRPRLADEHGRVLEEPVATRPAPASATPRHHGRLALVVFLALAVVAAMVLAFQMGASEDAAPERSSDTSGTEDAAPAAQTGPVAVVSAQDFDPQGQPAEENPDRAAEAVDGDPATAWPTKTYFRPNLGGLKDGVGLVLDLGTQVPVRQLEVTLAGPGTTDVEVRTTPAGVNSPPVELDDVGRAVASATLPAKGGEVTLQQATTTRYVLLWITSLPKVSAGKFRAEVAEVTVRQ